MTSGSGTLDATTILFDRIAARRARAIRRGIDAIRWRGMTPHRAAFALANLLAAAEYRRFSDLDPDERAGYMSDARGILAAVESGEVVE